MARIALEAEKLFDYRGWSDRFVQPLELAERGHTPLPHDIAEVICYSADRIGDSLGASAIIALTHSGSTARLVAKYRPSSKLIAVTDNLATQRALAMTWGVQCLLLDHFTDTLEVLSQADRLATERGLVKPGDVLVFTGGLPLPAPGRTTLLKVQIAGEPPVA